MSFFLYEQNADQYDTGGNMSGINAQHCKTIFPILDVIKKGLIIARVALFFMSCKWPKLCRFMYFLEMVSTNIDLRFPSKHVDDENTWTQLRKMAAN